MATVPETKKETASPQKLSAESKNDNAGCAAEKCDLKLQENNECRESADNMKNQRKDDKQADGDVVSHPAAEKNGAQAQPSSSPAKKESRKKPHDDQSQPKPEDQEEKDEDDEDGDDEEEPDEDEDEDDEEAAGEPDMKRRRTLETNELADKGKVDLLNENGPEEVAEELKNGNSAEN